MAKITKQAASYRPSAPGTRKCGNCSMFRGGSCSLVEGSISASGTCRYWEQAKKGERK